MISANFAIMICSIFIISLYSQNLKEANLGSQKITLEKGNEVTIDKNGTKYKFLVGDSAWVMMNAKKELKLIYWGEKSKRLDTLNHMYKELNNFLKEKNQRLLESVKLEQSMNDQILKISKERESLNLKTIELYKEQRLKRHIYSFVLGAVAGAFWAEKEDGDLIKISKVLGMAGLSTYISIELH